MQRGVDSFIFENSAYIYNVASVEDQISSLDEVYIQDVSSTIPFSISDFLHNETISNLEEERHSSQYEDKEDESYTSSDEGKFVDPAYCEEASYEVDDEIFFSSK